MAEVDIIIPSLVPSILVECLKRVEFFTQNVDYKIIIVSDEPTDEMKGLLDRLKTNPKYQILVGDKKQGLSHALNEGMKLSTAPFVVLMNDDILVSQNWLQLLLMVLRNTPTLGAVTPQLRGKTKGYFADVLACGLFTREAINKIGPLDEAPEFKYGCADADYYLRLKHAGYIIHGVCDSIVDHIVGATDKPEGIDKQVSPMKQLYKKWGDEIYVDQHRLPSITTRFNSVNILDGDRKLHVFNLPFNPTGKILEIGCGDNPLHYDPDWTTIDCRKLWTVDIVSDLESDFPVPCEAYDGVYSSFIMEHIPWPKVQQFANECWRVLKPGGSIFMVTPNTLEQCRHIANKGMIGKDETCMLFGGQDDGGWNAHKGALSPDRMKRLLMEAGFEDIQSFPWTVNTDMYTVATKKSRDAHFVAKCPEFDESIKHKENEVTSIMPNTETPKVDELKVKINFGSFTVMFKNWLNVDILDMSNYARENGFLFKQHDVTKPIPCDSNSVDAIVASHLLEHISRKDGARFLAECFRIMKPGATIRIAIPDALIISREYSDGYIKAAFDYNEGVKAAEDDAEAFWNLMFFGHSTAYDSECLISKMKKVGFSDVKGMPANTSRCADIQNETKDMYPDHTSYVEGTKPEVTIIEAPNIITRVIDIRDKVIDVSTPLNIGLVSTAFFGCPPKGYSGLEMIVWDLAEGLSELGHKVRLFAPQGSATPTGGELVITGPALDTVNVDWLQAEEHINEVIQTYYKDLDILHGHNWFGHEYLLRNIGPKICHTHHGHLNPDWWTQPDFKLNLFAISKWMKEQYKKLGINSETVYNGIDLSRYLFQEKKGDRLLYVGRISKFKQPHIAIALAKKLGVGLDIVGGTFVDDKQYLEDIKNSCDGKIITFNPDVPHEVKVSFMQNAKALVFPSAMGEPFGLVAAEAMACGTPVIALNDGAISEVVADSKSGWICENIDEMKVGYEHLGLITPQNCRSQAEKFSRLEMAKNYVMFYKKLLNGQEW
jgi:glycosyltransferase involved in cell wall biosynthesis/predicted SAM-dependent methyltransferase